MKNYGPVRRTEVERMWEDGELLTIASETVRREFANANLRLAMLPNGRLLAFGLRDGRNECLFAGDFKDFAEFENYVRRWRIFTRKAGWWARCRYVPHTMVYNSPEDCTWVKLDERGRPHSVSGPACEINGRKWYYMNGIKVPIWTVEEPGRLSFKSIMNIPNAEVRRVLVNSIGAERLVAGAGKDAEVIDTDTDKQGGKRTLYRIRINGSGRSLDERAHIVQVTCPSTEGEYYLRVPPDVNSCAAAVAWSFREKEETYAPAIET